MILAEVCPLCLAGKLELRYDKKSRPYCVCTTGCIRLFARNSRALVALAFWSDLLQTRMNVERLRAFLDTYVPELYKGTEYVRGHEQPVSATAGIEVDNSSSS